MPYYFGEEVNDLDLISDLVRSEYAKFEALAGQELVSGHSYSVGYLFTGLAGGDVANILAENPDSSESYMLVYTRFISEGKFYAHKSLNVSVTSTGTQIDVSQRRSDHTDGNQTVAYRGATVDETNAREFSRKLVGSGGIGGANVSTPEALIAPGDNVYLEATSQGGSDITIDLDFAEIPVELVDEIESLR